MTKFIFMPPYKNWFTGLGLHHAAITIAFILILSFIGLGDFAAAFSIGWYGQREYGLGIYPPKTFEVMDFASPATISILYLIY